MSARIGVAVMAALLALYIVLVGWRAVALVSTGDPVAVTMGVVLIVLPLVALTIPVLMGKLLLSARFFAIGCALIAALDVALLFVGVKLFQRETILTRWSQ